MRTARIRLDGGPRSARDVRVLDDPALPPRSAASADRTVAVPARSIVLVELQ